MSEKWITSIGLDIGTSTTKFIVSKLLIREMKNSFTLPKCQIVDRKVTYTSSIYTTPLKNQYEIDIAQLNEILKKEYNSSQLTISEIKAGAVIITGEAAKRNNAQSIIHFLAERAGDFVVATAGADLEGILAGKGSGACKQSTFKDSIVANVDIGGGTANVALFHRGKAVQTITFHIGGRLIRLYENGEIYYISDYIRPWLHANNLYIQIGDKLTFSQIQEICVKMVDSMLSFLNGSSKFSADLLLLKPQLTKVLPIEELIISGGVGNMMKTICPTTMREATIHGDIGPLLAHALSNSLREYRYSIKKAEETTRATVIGAGMQNTEVSGATIFINKKRLPLKNIPIMKVSVEVNKKWNEKSFQIRLNELLNQSRQIYDANRNPPFALALTDISYCTYEKLQGMANSIINQFYQHFPQCNCLLILCEIDIAKALGQAIKKHDKRKIDVLCVDQVDFTNGDYIDLGFPVAGEAISISVKTLAF